MTEKDRKELQERIAIIKTRVLMEEPCPIYEGDESDWEDFWYGNDEED